MSNLAKIENSYFAPDKLKNALEMCELIAQSGFCPKPYAGKQGDVLVAIEYGREVGLSPMQSLQCIATVHGIPSLYGDGFMAVIESHPDYIDKKEIFNDESATCTMYRKNREPVSRTFTIDDAMRADLVRDKTRKYPESKNFSDAWKKYPGVMLLWRARGFSGRTLFPDALKGMILKQEADDIIDSKASEENEKQQYIVKNETEKVNAIFDQLKSKAGDIKENCEPIIEKNEETIIDEAVATDVVDTQKEALVVNVHSLISAKNIEPATVDKWLAKAGVSNLGDMRNEDLEKIINFILKTKN